MKQTNPIHKKCLAILYLALITFSALTRADNIAGNNGPIEITPLVHSSVQLEYDGFVVQVDPWAAVDISHAKTADLILVIAPRQASICSWLMRPLATVAA